MNTTDHALNMIRKGVNLFKAGKEENNEAKQNQAARVIRKYAGQLPAKTRFTTLFKKVFGCEATHSEYSTTLKGYVTAGYEGAEDSEWSVGLIKRSSGYVLALDMMDTGEGDIRTPECFFNAYLNA